MYFTTKKELVLNIVKYEGITRSYKAATKLIARSDTDRVIDRRTNGRP